jgi:hypothetical protein
MRYAIGAVLRSCAPKLKAHNAMRPRERGAVGLLGPETD